MVVGSKLQVYNGTADKTAGGLTKSDLMKSPRTGKIISKRQYQNGLKQAKNLGITPMRRARGSGVVGSIFDAIGLGVPASRGGRRPRKARKAKGSGVVGSLFDAIGLGVPASRGGRKPRKARSTKGKGISKLVGLMSRSRKVKGKGVPRSRGGKRARKTKGGAWYDDLGHGFKEGVGIGTKIAGLIL